MPAAWAAHHMTEVWAANQAPTAAASSSPNPVADDVTALALTGTASSDPDGTIRSYLWEQVSGKAGYFATPQGGTSTFTPDPYAAAVLVDSPVLFLRFEEQSGTFASDVGGHVGTPVGAIHGAAGKLGWCPSFDGVDDYVSVPDAVDLRVTGDLTLEAWIYPTRGNNSGYSGLIAKQDAGDKPAYDWAIPFNEGRLRYGHALAAGGASYATPPTTGKIPTNAWTHVAIVKTNAAVAFYYNGVADGPAVAFTAGAAFAATAPVHIGQRNDGGFSRFPGRIDSVAIYASALTAARLLAHFNAVSL